MFELFARALDRALMKNEDVFEKLGDCSHSGMVKNTGEAPSAAAHRREHPHPSAVLSLEGAEGCLGSRFGSCVVFLTLVLPSPGSSLKKALWHLLENCRAAGRCVPLKFSHEFGKESLSTNNIAFYSGGSF